MSQEKGANKVHAGPPYANIGYLSSPDRFDKKRALPDAAAFRQAGIVRVKEVERDDGRIEVEGYDAQGRKIELVMDAGGKRVLATRVDHRWDD